MFELGIIVSESECVVFVMSCRSGKEWRIRCRLNLQNQQRDGMAYNWGDGKPRSSRSRSGLDSKLGT